MNALQDYQRFVLDAEKEAAFTQWAKQNPKEFTAWQAFNHSVQLTTAPILEFSPSKTAYAQDLYDAAVLYFDTLPGVPIPPPPTPAPSFNWFLPTSMVNEKLDPNAKLNPNYKAFAQMLYNAPSTNSIWPNSTDWTTTIARATASTPKAWVTLQIPFVNADGSSSNRVQIPWDTSWKVSGGDGHIGIIDVNGIGYEFEALNPANMTAHSMETMDLVNGLGVNNINAVADLSPFLGLIRLEDVQAGVINHALRCNVPTLAPSFVPPAIRSDGVTPGGLSSGMRMRLDPTLDISGLDPFPKMMSKCLQDYGVFVGDQGGGVAIFVQSTEDNMTHFPVAIEGLPKSWVLNLQVLA